MWYDRQAGYDAARNAVRVLPENETLFGEALVAQRRTVISINSAFGVSRLRQTSTGTGSSSVDTSQKGKIILQTGATAGSNRKLASAEVGQYAPGFAAEIGIGVRMEQELDGTAKARWGGLSTDGENGLYLAYETGDELFAVRRQNDTEQDKIARANWNLDPFDGTGPSGLNIATTRGYIWQVDFSWYGYGLILYGLARGIPTSPEIQHFIPGHYIQVEDDISINEPNLQIFADIDNGDQSTDYALNIGGMQYSVVGINDGARQRNVDDYVTNIGVNNTDDTHLISFQRKSAFLNRSFQLEAIDVVASGDRVIFEIWLGGTVTGATYDTPTGYDADETSIESAREATSFDRTGAILLYRTKAEAGGGNKAGNAASPVIDLNLPFSEVVTVTARTEAASATVEWCEVNGREGW